jgi:hypothetical protein
MSEQGASAFRVGYVAGYGLGVLGQSGTNEGLHTPWTNYVPAWVDEAQENAEWKRGWDCGFRYGKVNKPPVRRAPYRLTSVEMTAMMAHFRQVMDNTNPISAPFSITDQAMEIPEYE